MRLKSTSDFYMNSFNMSPFYMNSFYMNLFYSTTLLCFLMYDRFPATFVKSKVV